MRASLAIVICAALPLFATAATLHVPQEQPTIQAGIDAAVVGDTVLVACGTYDEHDIEMKSGVCLRSETGDYECVIINAGFQGRVMRCAYADASTRIEGVSLMNGSAHGYGDGSTFDGGGLYLYHASPAIRDCRFRNNYALSQGGGVYCTGSSTPAFGNCRIVNNECEGQGAGMYLYGCSPAVINSTFHNNRNPLFRFIHGGGVACSAASPEFVGCTFSQNQADTGGAFWIQNDSSLLLSECTIAENTANEGGGLEALGGASAALDHCIIAYSGNGSAVLCETDAGTISLSCCDLYDNDGGDWTGCIAEQLGQDGNISADPLFCSPPGNGDFTLHGQSPCAEANSDCGRIGAWPVACGLTALEPATWSAVKSLY